MDRAERFKRPSGFMPFQAAFVWASRLSPERRAPIWKLVSRVLYESISLLDRSGGLTCLNYGYAKVDDLVPDLILTAADEPNRYFLQLYESVAGAVDVRGKDLLEVGCGRGGGASFVVRHFQPASYTGLDLAARAVSFCNRHHHLRGLSFRQGDAENLPFPQATFDAAINIESSIHYPSMERFLQEVYRVLRPGGYFLYADWRPSSDVALLHDVLARSDLKVLEQGQITGNVVRALELDAARRLAQINAGRSPEGLRRMFRDLAGLPGSDVYQQFTERSKEYWRFLLQKPALIAPA